jgi:arylsulfatase
MDVLGECRRRPDIVEKMYTTKFEFTEGTIRRIVLDIADDVYVDVEAHLAAAMARD